MNGDIAAAESATGGIAVTQANKELVVGSVRSVVVNVDCEADGRTFLSEFGRAGKANVTGAEGDGGDFAGGEGNAGRRVAVGEIVMRLLLGLLDGEVEGGGAD